MNHFTLRTLRTVFIAVDSHLFSIQMQLKILAEVLSGKIFFWLENLPQLGLKKSLNTKHGAAGKQKINLIHL